MFPALFSTPYELCRFGGAYNNEVKITERQDAASSSDTVVFTPQWSPEALRPMIGKAQLLIRPQHSILEKAQDLRAPKVIHIV